MELFWISAGAGVFIFLFFAGLALMAKADRR